MGAISARAVLALPAGATGASVAIAIVDPACSVVGEQITHQPEHFDHVANVALAAGIPGGPAKAVVQRPKTEFVIGAIISKRPVRRATAAEIMATMTNS